MKSFAFDNLPAVDEIELELDFTYYHLPGGFSWPPGLFREVTQ